MANSAGFRDSAAKRLIKKPDKAGVTYAHTFKNLIMGDVALAIERVLFEMKLPFEEISTIKTSGMTGQSEEIPFIRHMSGGHEIPFGTFRVEGIGDIQMNVDSMGFPSIKLTAILSDKANKPLWNRFLTEVASSAAKNSIFQGKAVVIEESEDILVPKPLDLGKEVDLIFNPDVEEELATTVFWPILNRELAHKVGIRTRRGAIFDGHYGSGKSLLLYRAAQLANRNGWGVLHVGSGMISAAIMMASILEPVVIVIEDIDASTHGDRDRLNGLLNKISSVSTKTTGDYMLLLSTNFLKRIDPALLRPERIDALVTIELPTVHTISRQIRMFCGSHLQDAVSIEKASEAMAGSTPAIVAEVCQRAMIDAQRSSNGTREFVTESSLLFHTKRMERQKEFAVPELRTATTGDQLADTLYKVTQGMGE